jgi:hypothetical protein
MPSIQIDLPLIVEPDVKRDLARKVGNIYAKTMQVHADLLTVSIHDLGDGGVWRCHEEGDPTPSALIMCDIRRGRPVETRASLAKHFPWAEPGSKSNSLSTRVTRCTTPTCTVSIKTGTAMNVATQPTRAAPHTEALRTHSSSSNARQGTPQTGMLSAGTLAWQRF